MSVESPFRHASLSHINRTAILASQIKTLHSVSHAIGRSSGLKLLLKNVLEILESEAGMGRGVITLTNPKTGEQTVQAVHENLPMPAKRISYRPGEGIMSCIVSSGHSIIVEDPAREPRFIHRLGLMNLNLPFIGVPIILEEGHVDGVIAVQPLFGNRDLLRDQELLVEVVGNLLAREIHNAGLTGELAEIMDPGSKGGDPLIADGFTAPWLEQWMTSPSMRVVLQRIVQAAKWDTPVLIQGESGTGKELTASAIHHLSPRADGPFIKVNCAALADNLLESELFGHEKGAFTGAISNRKGRFELAHGGTLFLDEIGEISPAFQAKLLRVLQDGTFERVGGTRTLQADVRLVVATNRDLYHEVQMGSFRSDLFYRLFIFPIQMPTLRERRADISGLAELLLGRIGLRQKRTLRLTPGAMTTLCNADWPGNVRELENTLERGAVMSTDGVIDAAHIIFTGPAHRVAMDTGMGAAAMDVGDPDLNERERVMAALDKSGWVQAKAARLLNMTPRQIAYRIKTLGVPMRQI
ncbi:MAG: nif-specific transcriptional activator NifA [Magnetococcales bacterium]|nr:nif-specific transcriptional activator NifA [Magnetococcales bacterium]